MKKIKALLLVSALALCALSGCGKKTAAETAAPAATAAETTAAAETVKETAAETKAEPAKKEAVTVIYTNDVHSYVYNTVTNKETKEKHPGLRLSSVAAMKKDMIAEGKNVLLVDAGDEIQGNIYGSFDKGETVINLMNSAAYDLACPGNHEFDYGVATFFDRAAQANYPFISSTFKNVSDNSLVLEPSKIFDLNGTKIAFVGISTPLTLTSTARTTFQDENKKQIYTFSGTKGLDEFYRDIQTAIDEVRDKADVVIGLGHIGVDADAIALGISSRDVIANTEGLDALIDGHSHTVMEGELIKNKNGKEILLTQTGTGLANIGVMTISENGKISTELVKEYPNSDAAMAALEDSTDAYIQEKMTVKIGELDTALCTHDPEKPELRLVRHRSTNLGDFITDAYYWYLNKVVGTGCDVVINNGGGLRAPIEAGDITYLSVKNVVPFGNNICMIKVTGAQLRDALENGAIMTGVWDPELNIPAEQGSFMHVAGIRYTIDASVTTSVEYENEVFKQVSGEYKVKDIQVYNRETGVYEDVDPEGTYTLGGIDYILRNGGSGLAFLGDCECVLTYVGPEAELVVEYVNNFKKEGEFAKISSANSPLSDYKNYLLDYENPYGSGRISIINVDYKK